MDVLVAVQVGIGAVTAAAVVVLLFQLRARDAALLAALRDLRAALEVQDRPAMLPPPPRPAEPPLRAFFTERPSPTPPGG